MAYIPLSVTEKNLLPTVYFKKITLEGGNHQPVQSRHLLPTVPSGGCGHPQDTSAECRALDIGVWDQGLTVSLDLVMKFEIDTTSTSQLFLSEDLLQYARIKIFRLTYAQEERVAHGGDDVFYFSTGKRPNPKVLDEWGADPGNLAKEIKDISLTELIESDLSAYPSSIVSGPNGNVTLVTVDLNVGSDDGIVDRMGNAEIPANLAYYTYCYYDTKALTAAYGVDVGENPENYTGNVTGEEVLVNSETVKTSTVYIIAPVHTAEASSKFGTRGTPKPEDIGTIWHGEVDCWEFQPGREPLPDSGGNISPHDFVTDEGKNICSTFATRVISTSQKGVEYNNLILEKISIPNTKINDYRIFDEILSSGLVLIPATNIIDDILNTLPCKGVGAPATIINSSDWFGDASPYLAQKTQDYYGFSCTPTERVKTDAPDIYFSEAYLSRDYDGNCRFLFQIDYNRIIRDKSLFGSLYSEYQSSLSMDKIRALSPILNLRIVRRQIDPINSYNRLGSPLEGRVRDQLNNMTEFLVESRDGTNRNLDSKNNGKGEIKENSAIQTSEGAQLLVDGVRTFVVSDFSLHGVSGGDFFTVNYSYDRIESMDAPPDIGIYGTGTDEETYEERQTRLAAAESHYAKGTYAKAADPPAGPAPIYYQYGIEMEVEDGTIPFLNFLLDSTNEATLGLRMIRTRLVDYYNKLEQYDRSKKYYNMTTKIALAESAWSKKHGRPHWIRKQSRKGNYLYPIAGPKNSQTLPWKKSNGLPADLARIVYAITASQRAEMYRIINFTDDILKKVAAINGTLQLDPDTLADKFYAFLNPTNATPKSVNSMIVLVDRLIETVESALGSYLTPTTQNTIFTPSSVGKSYKRGIMTLSKYFYDVFDSNSPDDVYLDFLSEGKYGSLFNMSLSTLEKRANSEVKMYFKSDKQEEIKAKGHVETPYDAVQFENILNTDATKAKVWSCANISVGTNKNVKRIDSGLKMMDVSGPGLDKYTSTSAMAIALNMKDFNRHGGTLEENGVAAMQHLLVKLGVSVIPKAIPKVLVSDVINITDTRYVPVAQILGDKDPLVRENLVVYSLDRSMFELEYETVRKSHEKDFSDALPILKGLVGNVARNGAYVAKNPSGRITNPHKIIGPAMNREMYNVKSSKSLFERSRNSALPSHAGAVGIAQQSLMACGTGAPIWNPIGDLEVDFSQGAGSVSTDTGPKHDEFIGPNGALMTWNYEILADIETLVGFTRDGSGKRVLNWPRWESPDQFIWAEILGRLQEDSNENAYILCRVSLKEDAELGVVPPPGVILPIVNKYFTLTREDIIGTFGVEAGENTDSGLRASVI